MGYETELLIRVTGDRLTDTEVAAAGRGLRWELLDVADVSAPHRPAPAAGAKSGAAAAIGMLMISAGPTTITAVLDVALGWLRRQPLDVALEIDGHRFSGPVTRAQRDALVETYLRRVEVGDAP